MLPSPIAPEELMAQFRAANEKQLPARTEFSREEVLILMSGASLRGFQKGSAIALSMIEGALAMQKMKLPPA